MSKPVQHHFLPERAYLKFFQAPNKPGRIWQYQRGGDPVLVNIEKVAKERHLYSFRRQDVTLSTEVETLLQRIEHEAQSLLERLNAGPGDVTLTADEETRLAEFAAVQAVRTPAQRRAVGEMLGGLVKSLFDMNIADSKVFRRQAQRMIASGKLAPDTDVEKLRRDVVAADFDVVTD